jgi:UDP-GlcNAc3NAcA epimerase
MKIVTIVGARPQFIKAAVVSVALARCSVLERIVHTGQHYDERMSKVFFDELGIPRPGYNLAVGSGSHGAQTGVMLAKIEEVLLAEQPDFVLVYGDTNSTLAGSLAAAKLHRPVAHVEAGLRSFNRRMPEEINRVVTDHVSDLLFCPTEEAVRNLRSEGITQGVSLVGDVMYDCAMTFADVASRKVDPLREIGVTPRDYILLTCHRAENTDDPQRLANILRAANTAAEELPVVFPVHPRTRKLLEEHGALFSRYFHLIEPASYLEMLLLERNAAVVMTDSGGVQKEAFIFGVPCVTLREETEWVETVTCGANVLGGANYDDILESLRGQMGRTPGSLPDAGPYYGGGHAAERIAELLARL